MRIFVDLGAYRGDTLELAMLTCPPFDRYYAFEPCDASFRTMEKAFKGRPGVECIHAAAGTADGTTRLYHHEDASGWFRRLFANENAGEGHSTMATKTNVDTRSFETVPVVDLSRFLREHAKPEDEVVLKVDIEGGEYDLLEKLLADGAIDLVDKLYCEWHRHKMPVAEGRHEALLEKLAKSGYPLTGDNEKDEFHQVARSDMLLTVVVATFNRSAVLKQLLDHLKRQTDMNFEVVVAIDGSTDDTEAMLAEYRKDAPFELRWLNTGKTDTYGLAEARNRGIKDARGRAVVILDDDSFPEPGFVAEHKKSVTRKTLTGGMRNSVVPEEKMRLKMQEYFEVYGDCRPQRFRPFRKYAANKYVVENNTCMLKEDWVASGLFDESITKYGGIGQEFNRRLIGLDYRYQFNPRAGIIHHTEFKQNEQYEKISGDEVWKLPAGTVNVSATRGFLKKYVPPVYWLLKWIKNTVEYRSWRR
ncbi:MAG: methyltransferase FkbM [Planctomycetota bacterium]|nr:MAG: methyltransferase FkbM [Planctomycetota bacterium]